MRGRAKEWMERARLLGREAGTAAEEWAWRREAGLGLGLAVAGSRPLAPRGQMARRLVLERKMALGLKTELEAG